MKKFIISVLCVAVFFIGLGSLVEKAGARFKSDTKALETVRLAREAIGGDAAIRNVRGLTVTGRTAHTFNFDGTERVEQGDLGINLQLPNQFAKTLRFANQNGAGKNVEQDVFIVRKRADKAEAGSEFPTDGTKRVFRIKRADGEKTEIPLDEANIDIKKILVDKDLKLNHDRVGVRQNELFRTTFALLLSAPEGADVSYTYGGESTVDGNACDVVVAQSTGDAVKLFIDKSTHLPLMMSYQGVKPFVFKLDKNETAGAPARNFRVIRNNAVPEIAEVQVKFSDYRSVGGVTLPFKWTQTLNGQTDQVIDIVNYEINPANIAEKFTKPVNRMILRTGKPQ